MSLDDQNGIEPSVSKNSTQRRTFLKRASAGAVIASIPGRSAWAGLAGSIVASGHGSDMNQGVCTQLLSHGFWKNNTGDWAVATSTTFLTAFGGEPIDPTDTTTGKTLLDVLNNGGNGPSGLGGPGNVNCHMAAMYLTAAHFSVNPVGNSLGIYYPAVQQHGTLADYGSYLYSEALLDPSGVGLLLKDTIATYHVGSSICL
ncbi:MAG: hypothetical protein JKY14_13460 [Paraglaciecola sp.]|nr:hypothetical protein [Paraglaciecola sp.]